MDLFKLFVKEMRYYLRNKFRNAHFIAFCDSVQMNTVVLFYSFITMKISTDVYKLITEMTSYFNNIGTEMEL